MQTFLNESTFEGIAHALDGKHRDPYTGRHMGGRRAKQLIECVQIFKALGGYYEKAWVNHPATVMWRGAEAVLLDYAGAMRDALEAADEPWETAWDTISSVFSERPEWNDHDTLPLWWSDPVQRERIIATHRGRLYHKAPHLYPTYKVDGLMLDKYRQHLVCCPFRKPNNCQYYWPSHVA